MQLPLSWLNQFIHLNHSPEELAELLTLAGLEVDGIEPAPLSFEGVVVGEVVEAEPHPDADRLTLAQVSDGTETFQVVCGAANCRKGIKVAFAKVGARLEGGKIKKGKIRGVESQGMLCAEAELGLAESSEGIMELPAETQLGQDVRALYSDLIAEISLTPNLGHCASVYGVARELAALTCEPYHVPQTNLQEEGDAITQKVRVEAPDLCPRYACRVIKGVKVGPSPAEISRKLEMCGMRSVNNVIDATNLTMLELGHPLHAFDLSKVEGDLIVRTAEQGEKLTTLDEIERELPEGTLLVCDEKKPVAVAGVMGGANSEVDERTVDLLVESAYFAPSAVRAASKGLNLSSESSKRFERGTDPNMVTRALDRACSLIAQLAEGQVQTGTVDVREESFPRARVSGRVSRTNALLGTQLSRGEIEGILRRLEFEVTWDDEDRFHVEVPTYRSDVSREVDLIEEVGRLYGMHNLPERPSRYKASDIPHAATFCFEEEVRRRLIAEGLQEFVCNNLIGETAACAIPNPDLPKESWVRVLNPSSVEQSILRTTLLPGLLTAVGRNFHHGEFDIAAFELGRVHFKLEGDYQEQPMGAILLTGEADFLQLKGIVENLLSGLGIAPLPFEKGDLEVFHPGRQAKIGPVGVMGELHPAVLRKFDIDRPVLAATFSLYDLEAKQKGDPQMEPLAQFPGSERDWTITVDEALPYATLVEAVHTVPSRLLQKVELRDIYRSASIGADKKNVTLRFLYRDARKTLSVKAVESEHVRIVQGVQQSLVGDLG